jgi:hypothetical protein
VNLRQLHVIGHSIEGRPIELWSDPPGADSTLIIGGIHGDEPATIELVREFNPAAETPPLALLPLANPDGFERATRYNARGVDINRNAGFNWRPNSTEPAGPAPWSEPETRALQELILTWRPAKIVSLHWALGEIDADGVQSTPLAEAMWTSISEAERIPYRLRVTELGRGQRRLQKTYAECPGSIGQWAGYGLIYSDDTQPAIITLELPYDSSLPRPEILPDAHLAEVHASWKRDPNAYLASVRPAVMKMLAAAATHRQSSR